MVVNFAVAVVKQLFVYNLGPTVTDNVENVESVPNFQKSLEKFTFFPDSFSCQFSDNFYAYLADLVVVHTRIDDHAAVKLEKLD
jgi:hypothetical protein